MVKEIQDEGYADGNEEWERCEAIVEMNFVHFCYFWSSVLQSRCNSLGSTEYLGADLMLM